MGVKKRGKRWSWFFGVLVVLMAGTAVFYADPAFAQGAEMGIGKIAETITGSFKAVGKLMFAVAYLAGFGFVIAAIFKFKQHKDNPTQITMGTPIALLIIGIALIFLPALITPAGETLLGKAAGPGDVGGFRGGGVEKIPGAGL